MILGGSVLFAADTAHGIELYKQKNYESASQELRQVVDAEGENSQARYYLALSLLELQQFDEAQKQLEAVVVSEEGEPSAPDIKVALARVSMGRDQFDEAGALLGQALELAPEHVEARLRKAELDLERKDYATAAKDAEAVISQKPDTAYAHYYAGIAYSNLKRPDKMAEHFQKFLTLAPDAPEAAKVQSLMRSLRR